VASTFVRSTDPAKILSADAGHRVASLCAHDGDGTRRARLDIVVSVVVRLEVATILLGLVDLGDLAAEAHGERAAHVGDGRMALPERELEGRSSLICLDEGEDILEDLVVSRGHPHGTEDPRHLVGHVSSRRLMVGESMAQLAQLGSPLLPGRELRRLQHLGRPLEELLARLQGLPQLRRHLIATRAAHRDQRRHLHSVRLLRALVHETRPHLLAEDAPAAATRARHRLHRPSLLALMSRQVPAETVQANGSFAVARTAQHRVQILAWKILETHRTDVVRLDGFL